MVIDCFRSQDWDYLALRFWIGMWIFIILMILVAVDASALVCYITRFTEENFATLIAFIFIAKAVENVIKIGSKYPIDRHGASFVVCECIPPLSYSENLPSPLNWTALDPIECMVSYISLLGILCPRLGTE